MVSLLDLYFPQVEKLTLLGGVEEVDCRVISISIWAGIFVGLSLDLGFRVINRNINAIIIDRCVGHAYEYRGCGDAFEISEVLIGQLLSDALGILAVHRELITPFVESPLSFEKGSFRQALRVQPRHFISGVDKEREGREA